MTTRGEGRALVLGGGGVTGQAWAVGLLLGLHEQGVDLGGADMIIGTSAGASVAAQLTSGVPLAELYARQLEPSTEASVGLDPGQMNRMLAAIVDEVGPDPLKIRQRIGQLALAAPTLSETEYRAITASRLPTTSWPQQRLRIVAVDAHSGEARVFDRASGVELIDAVAASSALPGVRPPMTIEGRRYLDGAVRSLTNADLAQGAQRVLIVALSDSTGPLSTLKQEVAQLETAGALVKVMSPDEASREASGTNMLDRSRRGVAAQAGRTQGQRVAAELQDFWKSEAAG